MDRRQLHKILKENGFILARVKKHEIWKRDNQTVIVPNNNKIEGRLYKKILCDIKRGKTIRYGG